MWKFISPGCPALSQKPQIIVDSRRKNVIIEIIIVVIFISKLPPYCLTTLSTSISINLLRSLSSKKSTPLYMRNASVDIPISWMG